MTITKPRRFPVPASARTAILGSAATIDNLDLAATLGSPWAAGVIAKENTRLLASVCGSDNRLPHGVLDDTGDDELAVTGLTRDGHLWTPTAVGWNPSPASHPLESVPLNADEVAFVARALTEGYTHVLLRGYTPAAFIPDTAISAAAGSNDLADLGSDLPEGAKVLAVVDDLDRNAVLDLVAVLPGPKVLRRHDGTWQEDPSWVNILRSVKPPPVVQLDEAQLGSVVPQIDESTAGLPFFKEPPKKTTVASAIDQRADEMAIEFALLAAKIASKTAPGGTMPAGFQRYWLAGEGAAKIRWGTPGAMTRCARHLTKYMTRNRAYAACNNISKKLGGKGVAWDVGARR